MPTKLLNKPNVSEHIAVVSNHSDPGTDFSPSYDQDVLEDLGAKLIVHNDEVNTFDWVISSLIEVCGHSSIQAEQCAMLIHFTGKYAVKTGSEDKLKAQREALTERGIQATIE
ncbi:MAG: ATP-dependent Clp protease adaptor ClpS [Chitinophagales bacterium]